MSPIPPVLEDEFLASSLLSSYTAARATSTTDSTPSSTLPDEHDDFLNPSVINPLNDGGSSTPARGNEQRGQGVARRYMKQSMVASEPRRKVVAWEEDPSNVNVYQSKTPKGNKSGSTKLFQTPPSLAPGFFSTLDTAGLTVSLELDLALKRDVLSSITDRESCINRLKQLETGDPMVSKAYVRRLLQEVRAGGLNVVEGIGSWRRAVMSKDDASRKLSTPLTPSKHNSAHLPPLSGGSTFNDDNEGAKQALDRPHVYFRWRDENYLVKMLGDLNFLSAIPAVRQVMGREIVPRRNPFLLPQDVDMLNLMKRDDPAVTSDRDVERARNAARVILLEEKISMQQRERDEEKKEREDSYSSVLFPRTPIMPDPNTPTLLSEFDGPPRLNVRELKVFAKSANPPLALAQVLCCAKILVTGGEVKEMSKKVLRSVMRKPMIIVNGLEAFDVDAPVKNEILEALYPIVNAGRFSPEAIRKMSESIGGLTGWIKKFVNDKCNSLGWTDGKPVYSQPVTPANGLREAGVSPKHEKSKTVGYDGDSSSDEDERLSKRMGGAQNNVYVDMMNKLKEEVQALKRELEGQGLRVKDPQTAVNDWEDQGSVSSSVVDEPAGGGGKPARNQNVHLLQESIRLDGVQTIIKIQYTNNGSTVIFTGWDPLNNTVIKGCEMAGLWVDRETGFTPVELEAMPESFRRQKLRGLINQLAMTSTPHLNPTLPDIKSLSIHVDRLVVEGVRSFQSVVCDFYVSRTQDNDGLAVVLTEKGDAEADVSPQLMQPMTLQISDSELELLLAHQPGLYLRSQRKWASQKAICDWLITRIKIYENENAEGNNAEPSKYLAIDRNVPVPRSVENGSIDGAGNYKLKARQVGNEIILEAVPGEGVAEGERPMSRVKIGLAEFQSLGALDSIPKDEGAFPSKPKESFFSPLPGQTSRSVDLGRNPRTPLDGLLSRLSWTTKNGAPSLGLNRVLFQDLRIVSNSSCMLRGSVMNRDIIFQAHMLKLREGIEEEAVMDDIEDAYERVGGEMVKLITEEEMKGLLKQRQPHELQRLLNPHNRKELCEVLAGKLKLIKIGGTFRLETELHREKALLTIAVDSTHQDDVIGAIDIDDQMNLTQLRAAVEKEMDEEDLPLSFRFVSQGAPVSRNQENARLATSLLPVAVILSKNGGRRHQKLQPRKRDDEDSEFGFQEGGGRYDDSDGSESGKSKDTSKSRKKRRKKRQKKMRKAQLASLRSAKAPDPDGAIHEVNSYLSDASDLTSDSDDESSMSLSASRSSAGTKKKKRRKTSVMIEEKRRGSILDKRVVEKDAPGSPGKKSKEQLAKEKAEANKPKPPPKIPIPLASLVTATQDSTTLVTQVDMTNMVFRGDTVKIWRCGKEWEEWAISSDPQAPFNETTLTLSKPYKHKLKKEVVEEKRIPGVPTGVSRDRKKDDGGETSLPAFARPRQTQIGHRSSLLGKLGVTQPVEKTPEQIEEERIPDSGEVIPNLQVWIMSNPHADKRPLWRKQYDDGEVPFEIDFKESDKFESHFGVRMPWSELEKVVADVHGDMSDVLHQQRLDYFERVTPSKIITEAYGVLCSWHPVGKSIDNVKWAKFAREMKIFPAKNSTQVDLTFAKSVAGKKERKLDLRAFIACCTDIALVRYPSLKESPTAALTKLLMENVVMLGGVNKLAWKEAKRMAIVAEARRTCGQVRIASFHRRNVKRVLFLRKRYACIRAQTQLRRMISQKNLKQVQNLAEDSRMFRLRHASAVKCQKMARMFRWSKFFTKHLDDQIKEELERIRQYREKLNDKRKKRESATVFKRVKIIQGLYALIVMSRIDNRRQSTNFGLKAKVYLPSTQEHFKFTIEEDMLREYLEQALEIDSLSVQEIMDPSNLEYLTDRFMIRITSERPIVLFSRRNTTERGLLVDKSSQKISGELFVMFVYRSADDFVFRAYDPKNCGQLRVAITNKQLRMWLQEDNYRRIRKEEKEYKKKLFEAQKLKNAAATGEVVDMLELQKAKDFIQAHKEKEDAKERALKKQEEDEKKMEQGEMVMIEMETADKDDERDDEVEEVEGGEETEGAIVPLEDSEVAVDGGKEQLSIIEANDPPLMKAENQEACIEWLLERLRLSRNRRTKRKRLILQYEEDEDMKDEAACKLQGIWRQKQARRKIRKKARQQYEKMWDPQNYCYVYVNLRTGAMEWTKPLILGSEDLDDPKDEWRLITNSEDGSYYYQNPATGQTAYISTDEAAKKIQRMVRNFQASDIPTPTINEVVKALRFQRVAEANYEKDPNKLANIVNFALLNHCLLDNLKQARECYNIAIKKSSTNPILTRAYAMFTLAANDNPKAKVFKKACDMLKEASLADPDLEKFEVAQQSFFHWGVVSNPKNATALLNYALLHQCVLKDYDKAEKFYLRAMAVAPNDERVIDNFELMEKNRLPGGAYAGKGPSNVVLKRSEVVEERPEWGEWQRMFDRKSPDPTFKHFWYNKLARCTQFKEPNWKELWDIRAERSTISHETEEDGWVTYWDDQLRVEFYFNRLTMEFQPAEVPLEYDEGFGEPLALTY